jgi:3-methyladenine DNA glycosylase/8-oxoguanine DNA glycosylase
MTVINIATPAGFRFAPTVFGHGWHMLPPFRFDEETKSLERIHQFQNGTPARLMIREADAGDSLEVQIECRGRITKAMMLEVEQTVATSLNFELDLVTFHQHMRRHSSYRWVDKMGAGRLLVSPTVWEDLAKTLLTTNTTWVVTIQMVRRLVTLGEPFGDGLHAFPSPERIASMSVEDLNRHVKAGYRGPYLHALATAIVERKLDPESWRSPMISSTELFRELKAIKGFGDYAAGSMCRLLGRFDRLGLDSACRAMFKDQRNDGKPATDKQITDWYAPFGEWSGLAIWMDVIREHITWHVKKVGK